jgi:hypothetical protein
MENRLSISCGLISNLLTYHRTAVSLSTDDYTEKVMAQLKDPQNKNWTNSSERPPPPPIRNKTVMVRYYSSKNMAKSATSDSTPSGLAD